MTTSGSKLNQWTKTVLLATWWKRLWRILVLKKVAKSSRITVQERQQSASWRKQDRSVQSLDDYDEADQKEQRWKKRMAVCGITTTVAPLAPLNMNAPVPHTLAGPSMTASKENQFPPSFSGFQVQNFSVNPTMMRSQEQTMMNTFNSC